MIRLSGIDLVFTPRVKIVCGVVGCGLAELGALCAVGAYESFVRSSYVAGPVLGVLTVICAFVAWLLLYVSVIAEGGERYPAPPSRRVAVFRLVKVVLLVAGFACFLLGAVMVWLDVAAAAVLALVLAGTLALTSGRAVTEHVLKLRRLRLG